jgi:hypothetical protein
MKNKALFARPKKKKMKLISLPLFPFIQSCPEAVPLLRNGFVEFSEHSRKIIFRALQSPIGNDRELKQLITELRRESMMMLTLNQL